MTTPNHPELIPLLRRSYDAVKDFWLSFRQPIALHECDTSTKGRVLAATLIAEESVEYLNSTTVTERLDGIVDLLYVAQGAMMACGLSSDLFNKLPSKLPTFQRALAVFNFRLYEATVCIASCKNEIPAAVAGIAAHGKAEFPQFSKAFDIVHEANMTKLWTSKDVVSNWFDLVNYEPFQAPGKPDLFVVKRKSDGKIIKSPAFFHPDLSPYTLALNEN